MNDNVIRPSITFESIIFSDGTTLSFGDEEIVVFVGPNNAGKSASLRELQAWIARSQKQQIIINAELKKNGTSADLQAYLEKNALKSKDVASLTYSGMGYNIHHTHIQYLDQLVDRHVVAPFFSMRLATADRITSSDPAGSVALYEDPPTHPIHLLMQDSDLAECISGYFRRAFGKDLIVLRSGGSTFPLYVGEKPAKIGNEDELQKSFVDRLLANCVPLKDQGDGMRSFATVLLYGLAGGEQSVQFLDEPEAFLHPPQARLLGEYLASKRTAKSQLFIATHSTPILEGLMNENCDNVRIIRIRRDGDKNIVRELSKNKTKAVFNDTLTKYSNVLEGIFYQHVFITESDGDCVFYEAVLKTKSVVGEMHPDVLFIHASGKHRIAQLAETLTSLGVPVSVIVDIDILREENTFQELFEKLGGVWSEISHHWKSIKSSVEEKRISMNATQIKTLIEDALSKVSGIDPFPKDVDRDIKRILKSTSPWEDLKHVGKTGFKAGALNHFNQLSQKCSAKGLWIVPVGELEGFCRTIEAGHGPAFVEKVLEERDLDTAPDLEEARDFMTQIWKAAQTF